MVVINFWFKSPSWYLILLDSVKFKCDMTSLPQQHSCWKDPPLVEFTLRTLLHVSLAIFKRRLSLCVANLTKLLQEVTHCYQISVLLGQHDCNNICNLRRLILKKSGFTPLLINHKKGIFPLKRAFLS